MKFSKLNDKMRLQVCMGSKENGGYMGKTRFFRHQPAKKGVNSHFPVPKIDLF
jgi:hypothetical protein